MPRQYGSLSNRFFSGSVMLWMAVMIFWGMEWLFHMTKPSVLSVLSFTENLTILLLIPLLALSAVLPVFFGLTLVNERASTLFIKLFWSAMVLMCSFLLIDNFTYTIFSIYSGSFQDWRRYIYIVVLAILSIYWFRKSETLFVFVSKECSRPKRPLIFVVVIVLSAFMVGISAKHEVTDNFLSNVGEPEKTPNILILSSDGIDASHLPAYGYHRQTAPFIDKLKQNGLLVNNHFTNSANTTASVGALLAGKYPTTTRVIFRPDIFRDAHRFQHLPGLLKKLGYNNYDISARFYVDPVDMNMRSGFDYANGRDVSARKQWAVNILGFYWSDAALFYENVSARIVERLMHIFNLSDAENVYLQVTHVDDHKDRTRIDNLLELFENIEPPFFINTHLLGTHGAQFNPAKIQFSKGKEQQENWDNDFYDDAILTFDSYVQEVAEVLREKDFYEDTIIVITSDHARGWVISEPIPLLIAFPGAEHQGVLNTPSQRIDIAPTLLDYIGVAPPAWMEGNSLLQDLDNRFIFNTRRAESAGKEGRRYVPFPRAPYYTLGELSVSFCDRQYVWKLKEKEFFSQSISNFIGECESSDFSESEAKAAMKQHLNERGWDTSELW